MSLPQRAVDLTDTSNFSHLCTQCKKISQINISQDSHGYIISGYSMKLLVISYQKTRQVYILKLHIVLSTMSHVIAIH